MGQSEDLIDFGVIETVKENIQPVPSGRSAKSLSLLHSPPGPNIATPSNAQTIREERRHGFEKELISNQDADDPLETFDRYIKWTLDAYPSAENTPESRLLQLLERATKAFLDKPHYKNDPRYLKIWLLYLRFFSDSPRELYCFLGRHGVGECLSLFYEEYSAWLESVGRWLQAEEVYLTGLRKGAYPHERLQRKFTEFRLRKARNADGIDCPNSPALPKVRPALASKVDVFGENRVQGAGEESAGPDNPRKDQKKPSKLTVYSDSDKPASNVASRTETWIELGSVTERRKENDCEVRSWSGERLDGGKGARLGTKLEVFRDQVR